MAEGLHSGSGLAESAKVESEASQAEVLLRIKDASVSFGGMRALSGVTADCEAYSITAIVGPNGAGKTTLLNAISGLIRANTSGAIEFGGSDISGLRPAGIARAGIGRSFQDPRLLEHATVLENVMCGGHLLSGYGALAQLLRWRRVAHAERELRARAETVIEFVGLEDFRHESVSSLPYGRRKLADIARAMVCRPRLLLLDEPSSGLDAHERESVGRILRQIAESQTATALVVEHHMDLVRDTASHVLGLQAGQVIATGVAADVLDSEEFRASLIGGHHPGAKAEPVVASTETTDGGMR